MASLHDLPDQVLCIVAACIVPSPHGLDSSAASWRPAVACASASKELHFVLGELLREALPSLATLRPLETFNRTCWLNTLSALRLMNKGSWREIRTLRAVRPQSASLTPIHTAPRLSGASMCALGDDTLMVFGGRSSVSGHTFGQTYLLKVSWSASIVAKWDEVQCDASPSARCYHAASRFHDGVVIFGGAGDGDFDQLFSDTWFFRRARRVSPNGKDQAISSWEEMHQPTCAPSPTARSSFVLAAWRRRSTVVLHGGIGNHGTMSDTWIIDGSRCWRQMHTTGACVARAHHIGGVFNNHLLVHSGHDESLLTTSLIFALHLDDAVWMQVKWPDGPSPRIDAAASVLDDVGILIFGGVAADYEFESTDAWILPAIHGARFPQKLAVQKQPKLSQRACCCMCSDGLRTFIYGGFDGSEDLNDLWCLNLQPPCFHEYQRESQANSADNRTLVLLWELHHRLKGIDFDEWPIAAPH